MLMSEPRPERCIGDGNPCDRYETGICTGCHDRTSGRVSSWVVAIDRPYYSSVEEFTNESEAVVAYEKLVSEHASDNPFESKVYMAEVVREAPIRTVR